jgi:uncharacterized protein YjbI with pentapeptide repeats
MSTNTQSPKPKRRWCQFSLWTLLIAVSVFCVMAGWIGYRMRRAREHQDRVAAVEKAVAEIEKLGGTLTFAYEKRRPYTWLEYQFDDPGPADDAVRVLRVKVVNLVLPNVTDAHVAHLSALKHFALLRLNGTDVAQIDLANLKDLSNRAQTNRDRVAVIEKMVAKIEQLGGNVTSEYEERRDQTWMEKLLDDPGGLDDPVGVATITGVNLWQANDTDATLEHVSGLIAIRFVYLDRTNVTDEGLEQLRGLPKLERLFLPRTRVSNAGLEHLKGLPNLKALDLGGTNITDAGLVHLKGLIHLQYLGLSEANVTDAGLEHLAGLANLKYLNLSETKVTDAGLEKLKGLTHLEELYLRDTIVTDEGVKKLQRALPNCDILH